MTTGDVWERPRPEAHGESRDGAPQACRKVQVQCDEGACCVHSHCFFRAPHAPASQHLDFEKKLTCWVAALTETTRGDTRYGFGDDEPEKSAREAAAEAPSDVTPPVSERGSHH